MSFLSPAFLGALALVSIPLIIHLIRRRKLRVVRWAAMEFLLQSQRKQKRRLRIEELILLALRMLIIAFAAIAFARPVLRALGVPLLTQNERVYAVIVIDNSMSMGFRSEDVSSFDRAKAGADTVATQILRPGDAASVVLGSDRPEATVSAPSFDRELVRDHVRAATLSDHGTDFTATAQMVNSLLKASQAPIKEVYWLTDDQATGWTAGRREAARSVWIELGKAARLTWISVGPQAGARTNLAVETPALSRELVTPRLPARIEARIDNFGPTARNNMLINLVVDGKQAGTTRVSISPSGSALASFSYRFTQPGIHAGRVEIADPEHADGLPRDNSAAFVVRARQSIKVLVQDMKPATDPTRGESFYLVTAMAPGGAAESLAPTLREGASLGSANLRGYDAIVLTGATSLSRTDLSALAEYVRTGGGLLIFPGPETDVRRLNAELGGAGLLPATLAPIRRIDSDTGLTLNPSTITHPALSIFKDTANLNLTSARIAAYYPLEPVHVDKDPNATLVMIRYGNGDPALVERTFGLGRVILSANGAGISAGELPLRSSYVPLVYQLLSYLGQGPTSHRNLAPGEPLFVSLPVTAANHPVKLTDPDGHVSTLTTALDSRGLTLSYSGMSDSGLYRFEIPGTSVKDAFAVGLPASESDLSPTDPTAALTQAGFPPDHLAVANGPSQILASVRRSRYGAEVWRSLIWLLIPMLFLESYLAQRFGRRG